MDYVTNYFTEKELETLILLNLKMLSSLMNGYMKIFKMRLISLAIS